MGPPTSDLLREEARAHRESTWERRGDVLRVAPGWTRWLYWLLLLICAVGLLYVIVGQVPEYAEGPALVRLGRTVVSATAPGTVDSVEVPAGRLVAAGEVLVRFHDARERAEYKRICQAFDLQLINTLSDPSDQAARQALTALRAEKELAEAMLKEYCVPAPCAGIVGDIRIRRGQYFASGEPLLSLVHDETSAGSDGGATGPTVVALLPARYGPVLRRDLHEKSELDQDLTLRFEPAGYRHEHQEAVVTRVGDQALGPAAIGRYLGPELADGIPVQGLVVLVRARLRESTFDVDGKQYDYYHGMQGTAGVTVRSERIIYRLAPWLRALPKGKHD